MPLSFHMHLAAVNICESLTRKTQQIIPNNILICEFTFSFAYFYFCSWSLRRDARTSCDTMFELGHSTHCELYCGIQSIRSIIDCP